MSQLVNAQTVALQLEAVDDLVPLLFQRDDTLYSKIKKATDVRKVSSRAMRIPLFIGAGSTFTSGLNADGGDLGVGSGSNWVNFNITPVTMAEGCQITAEAEWATDEKDKAERDVAREEMKNTLVQFRSNIESLLQGDGSGVLGTAVTISSNSGTGAQTSSIVVDNPANFFDNQTIQVFSAVGGTNRGSVQISYTDSGNKTLWFATALPGGTANGDVLVVNGGSGAAGSNLLGIKYYQVASNTGTILGLNRGDYPGRLTTPNVNLNGAAVTPAAGRRAMSQIQQALGIEAPATQELEWYMNTDQHAAIENLYLNVSYVNMPQLSGSAGQDMIKENAPNTFVGRPIIASIKATPGRIDGLCLKNWGRAELRPLSTHNVGGQTVFPSYGGSGGIALSSMFYFLTAFNLFNRNVRAGVYLSNAAIPTGY